MKNTRDFILALSIIVNMGAFVTISKQHEQMNSFIERAAYYERKASSKEVKIENPPIDTLNLISNVSLSIKDLNFCIKTQRYEEYKAKAPKVIKELEQIISFTKGENDLKNLNKVKKIIGSNPTYIEIDEAFIIISNISEKEFLKNRK